MLFFCAVLLTQTQYFVIFVYSPPHCLTHYAFCGGRNADFEFTKNSFDSPNFNWETSACTSSKED